ncbi:MAG: hypothetical protein IJR72_05850 [Oscillospiraceae bacterium]|nr:hypothetical protein [Oscillospiraceae bacterium]
MRRHYVTLCVHGNTVVTYTRTESGVEVTFEQAKHKGFNTVVMDLDGGIIRNDGFPPAEVDYFQRFLRRNRDAIAEGAAEDA